MCKKKDFSNRFAVADVFFSKSNSQPEAKLNASVFFFFERLGLFTRLPQKHKHSIWNLQNLCIRENGFTNGNGDVDSINFLHQITTIPTYHVLVLKFKTIRVLLA